MSNLSNIGRIFYGIAIAALGFQTIYYSDFPYMLLPPNHDQIPGLAILSYISGTLLVVAGVCIVFEKKIRVVSLFLGTALLLIFCFYFIPFEFIADPNYMHFGAWENAEKELALSGGAFVMAGSFSEEKEKGLTGFLERLIPFGPLIFSATIISFGIDHFLYARDASEYVPSWIPSRIIWIYITGTALIGSGTAIIFKIRSGLAATLLGMMIFIWIIILHIPKVMAAPISDRKDEAASALLALAYCGIAFVIPRRSLSEP